MKTKIIIGIAALMLTTAVLAGSNENQGGEGGENHAGGESREQSLGQTGDNEAGAIQLTKSQTYDQVKGGARLIVAYDAAQNAFSGTVENTLTQVLRNVRVEIHLSNGTELGPEFYGNMAPGEIRAITLSSSNAAFASWTAHPETGSGEAGGESGGEGGDPSSPILALNQSWEGVVNGVRTSMSYNSITNAFSGTVENATAQTICGVQIELNLKQGNKTVVELGPQPVGDLAAGSAKAFIEMRVADEPLAANVTFDAWEIHREFTPCGGAASPSGEGSGEGHNERSESSREQHGSEGSGN